MTARGYQQKQDLGIFNPWKGWTMLSMFCVLQFLLQGAVGVLAGGIKETFQVDATAISILSSSFFYSYILTQIPAGLIYDRFGIRRVASLALVVVALSCMLIIVAPSFEKAVYSRILMGMGCAFGFVGLLTGIKFWFPADRFAFVSALAEALAMLGVAISNTVLSKVMLSYGWQLALGGCAGAALIIAALVFWALPKTPRTSAASPVSPGLGNELMAAPLVAVEEDAALGSFFADFKQLAQRKEVWLGGLFSACTFSVLSVFVALWGVPFLIDTYHLDVVVAASMVSTVYVGVAVSSPLIGWLATSVSYASLMATGSALSFFFMLLILYVPDLSWGVLYGAMFGLGFACSVYQLSFALVSRSVPNKVAGAAMGTTNMITMLSAPLMQPAVGMLLSYTADANSHDGLEVYSRLSYQSALTVLPIGLALAYVVALALRDKTSPSLSFWLKNWALSKIVARFKHAPRPTMPS